MTERPRVLVVEDEKDVRDLMVLHLKREGFETMTADDGEQAIAQLKTGSFGLVILDWMLPGSSGLEICKSLRAQGAEYPILMVTARADTSDIVLGLEMGADDYITKPFDLPVFLARVRTLLRRARPAGTLEPEQYRIAELSLNNASHEVRCAGQKLDLTPSEFKLLSALMGNQGRVLSRERLIDLVQGQGVVVVDRAIDTHVFGLRKKLGSCAEIIETVRGVGYRIAAHSVE